MNCKLFLSVWKRLNIFFLCLAFVFITHSCGVYSFSGANIPPEIKTLTVLNFYNNAGTGPANLGQRLTEDLKTYFQQNTNLVLTNTGGDITFDGSIVGYSTAPVAPTAATGGNPYPTSSRTRLTITVKVNLVNKKDEKANYEQSFAQYEDFDQSQSLTSVENDLIGKINQKLVFDIFNKTFSNW